MEELTIEQLVERLQKHPNPKAKVYVDVNMENSEDESKDVPGRIEIFNEDDFYEDFIELKVFSKGEAG